ncbi:hypothetical protein [Patulibacter sp.]|uniref:hypothetical protein n=1 Tax=Patulibacter sp. TaxID=1912859 RepID=UPI002724D0A9|nr:hypothetical protein [Patulibacter sp.]MDO9410460.1 hypothetical protein [Patulibacter sp.]
MRIRTRTPLALAAVTLALPLAGGAVTVPVASAQSTPDACAQALNPDRRTVYRMSNGGKTLGYARVVVTATKANRHRYCIQVQFDGRKLFHAFGQSSYIRRNGTWVNEGGLGDSGYRTGSYTKSMQVPDKRRIDQSFSVRVGGRWYRTISISRYNL